MAYRAASISAEHGASLAQRATRAAWPGRAAPRHAARHGRHARRPRLARESLCEHVPACDARSGSRAAQRGARRGARKGAHAARTQICGASAALAAPEARRCALQRAEHDATPRVSAERVRPRALFARTVTDAGGGGKPSAWEMMHSRRSRRMRCAALQPQHSRRPIDARRRCPRACDG